jgi:predicted ATPase/DNA-binding CsgD family transcriptional regulator
MAASDPPSAATNPRSAEPTRTTPDPPVGVRKAPAPRTPLIGRDRETATLCDLLCQDGLRLLTLIGPGGVGKTRLALNVAANVAGQFPDGVDFIPLAAVSEPALVLPTVARALGIRHAGDEPLLHLVQAVIGERRKLLILDNFEQVLPAAAELASLLDACLELRILVTSRALLRISGERGIPVSPLGLPGLDSDEPAAAGKRWFAQIAAADAVRLFVDRARALDPSFALTPDNATAVAEICRRLDGLPLAIELAAARSNAFSPATLVDGLERRLPLLTGGPRDQPARLRTMRDAITWSYNLLAPKEQTAFRQLAIFAGGFTLEAAESVLDQGSPVHDLLASLVDANLIHRGGGATGQDRFRMLETIREFALDELSAGGDDEEVSRRQAIWCLTFVEELQQRGGLSRGDGLGLLEDEHANCRTALAWLLDHDPQQALHLAGLLAEFWFRHEHLTEGQSWLERVLSAGDAATPERVEALVGLVTLLWPRRQHERAGQLLNEAEALANAIGDAGVLAYVRLHQGYLAALRGEIGLARARAEEARAYYTAAGNAVQLNGAIWILATVAVIAGDDALAARLYEELYALARGWDDEVSIGNILYGSGVLAARRGDAQQALSGFAEAAAVIRRTGGGWAASHAITGAAAAAAELGLLTPAGRLFAAAEALRRRVGAVAESPFLLDRAEQERALTAVRNALGPRRFGAAWEAGAKLSLDAAIAEAKRLGDQTAGPPLGAIANVKLTGRERDVLRQLARGATDKEIAATLGIARRTASNHVTALRRKFGVSSRSAVVAFGVGQGSSLVAPPASE